MAGQFLGWEWPEHRKMPENAVKLFSGVMVLSYIYLHRKGIGHFDNHCSNYNYDENGYPMIIDFGCA